jgi:putative addiction module antidote
MHMQNETTTKITTAGNSLAIRIPRGMAERMNLQPGTTVHIFQDRDGFKVTPYDPELQRQLEVAAEVQARNASALRTLADR